MQDEEIIALFFRRSETAVIEAQNKYKSLCTMIAGRILPDLRDSEECVNDAFLRVWNSIPPEKPHSLGAYLGRITRNLALDRYSYNHADKRNSSLTEAFEELEASLPVSSSCDTETVFFKQEFRKVINQFLKSQSAENRTYFIRRYWYGESIKEIADACHISEEKVKSSLFRTRNRLRHSLEKEGISL